MTMILGLSQEWRIPRIVLVLLKAAKERGCDVHHGKHMLSAQLDALCEFLVARPESWPGGWSFSSQRSVAEVSG